LLALKAVHAHGAAAELLRVIQQRFTLHTPLPSRHDREQHNARAQARDAEHDPPVTPQNSAHPKPPGINIVFFRFFANYIVAVLQVSDASTI
jgi:hypothetical protein